MVKSSVAPGATAKILQRRLQPPAGTLERTWRPAYRRHEATTGELHAAASLFKCGAHVSRIAAGQPQQHVLAPSQQHGVDRPQINHQAPETNALSAARCAVPAFMRVETAMAPARYQPK